MPKRSASRAWLLIQSFTVTTGKSAPYSCPFRVGAQRAGAAGAAAQVVEPDNEEAVGVHGFAGADHAVPPAGVFVVGVVAAGDVVVAGECVADQYGVGFVGVECAVGFHHQIEARQGLAVLQDKRLFERDFFRALPALCCRRRS